MAAGWLGCQPRSRLAVPRWRSQRLRRGNRGNRPASDYGAESREQGLSWARAMKQAGQAGPLAALSEDCLGPAGPPGRSLHPATPSIPDGPPRPLRQPCRQPRFASREPRRAATRPPGSPASGSAGVGRGGEPARRGRGLAGGGSGGGGVRGCVFLGFAEAGGLCCRHSCHSI